MKENRETGIATCSHMTVEKVLRSKRKKEIKEIYMSSFPKEERMPFALMMIMSCLWNTQFYAYYDKKNLCGLVYMATLGKQTFIMFIAVDAKLRSKGYGSSILNTIQAMYPKNTILVSIEPVDERAENKGQRLKRKNFYVRNGYQETGYFMKLAGQEQEILIKNGTFNKGKFIAFMAAYSCCAAIPKIWEAT